MSVYWRASSLNYSIQSRDFHCNGCPNVNFSAIMETILPKLVLKKKKQHSRSLEISGKKPPVSCKTSLEPNRKLISIVVCAFSVIRQLYGRSSTPINEYLCIVMFLSSGSNLKYACCKSLCSWLLYTMAAYIYIIYIYPCQWIENHLSESIQVCYIESPIFKQKRIGYGWLI